MWKSIALVGKLKSQIHNYCVSFWIHFYPGTKKLFRFAPRTLCKSSLSHSLLLHSLLSTQKAQNFAVNLEKKRMSSNERNLCCTNAGIRKSLHITGKNCRRAMTKGKKREKLFQHLCAEQTEGKKLTALFAAAVKVFVCFWKTPSGQRKKSSCDNEKKDSSIVYSINTRETRSKDILK